MRVVATTLGTSHRSPEQAHPLLARVLRAIIPSASPDFEKHYPAVRLWWVEVDEAGLPQRELGFDGTDTAIVAGPVGENLGYWTDSPMVFDEGKYEEVSTQAFADEWDKFVHSWNKSRLGGGTA